jgi:hypothetical protein
MPVPVVGKVLPSLFLAVKQVLPNCHAGLPCPCPALPAAIGLQGIQWPQRLNCVPGSEAFTLKKSLVHSLQVHSTRCAPKMHLCRLKSVYSGP